MSIRFFVSMALRLLAAIVMLQTLYFKFSAAPESVYIFTTLHLEPQGRIGIGIVELIASILLLLPRTIAFGAILGLSIMSGALASHLTILGIEVQGDRGYLFYLCLIVSVCCAVLAFMYKNQIAEFIQAIRTGKSQYEV